MDNIVQHIITFFIAVICSAIIAPLLVNAFQKKVDKKDSEREKILQERDEARKAVESQWHDNVTNMIKTLSFGIENLLNTTKKDNQELWNRLYNHGHEIECNNDDCHITFKGVTIPPNSGRRD